MSELLYQCMTKATTAEGENIRHSANWLLARRGTLEVWSDALVCGEWRIPFSAIDEAVLFRTSQMFIPCYVLRVKSGAKIYQFGLNPGAYWAGELPFPVVREKMVLGFSWFSLTVRLVIVACIAYLIWKWKQ